MSLKTIRSDRRRRPCWNSPVGIAIELGYALVGLTVFGLVTRLAVGAEVPAAGDTIPNSAVVELTLAPTEIVLSGAGRQQQLQVTARLADGSLRDATGVADFRLDDDRVARLDRALLFGVADGQGHVEARLGSHMVRAPLRVERFADFPAVDFATDVIPILSKLGCNSGGCHGKASGQNGFKLSVFGFDPQADYNALVKEARGRRVFPASPADSLLVAKPSGRIPHGGGLRLPADSPDYELLVQWIKQGLRPAVPNAPTLVAIHVGPAERVMRFSDEQQLLVSASYSDGSRRDVTAAAAYASNASLVAEVEPGGVVRVGRVPGQAAITVNYMGQVAVVDMQVPRPDSPRPYPELPISNPVDPLVWQRLERMGIIPSELADDATFLRRAFLDTIGMLPTPDEARRFLAEQSSDKRSRLVDALLAREEYADFWALKWSDILLVDRNRLAERGAYELHAWLREQFAANRPYDAWARELVTASGNSAVFGPANFYRTVDTPEAAARVLSQAFLGVRLECAQCHHHPFDRWSQDDFYGLAGFFSGLERKQIAPDRVLVYHAGFRETRVGASDRIAATRPLAADVPANLGQGDPRVKLAAWMTDPANPWFARMVSNRLWKHFFGRGLVEPEDDLRSTNPATNEPLLAYLAQRLSQDGYDLKSAMRLMLNSRAYQLSSVPNSTNADDEQNFSHHYVRRLPAEVMLDAICDATGSAESFPGRPPGTRATGLWDNRLPSYFLEIFGRPERNSPCECGRSSEPTMAQALHLMNAPEIEAKVAAVSGRVASLVAAKRSTGEMVEELCLATLSRPASPRERRVAEQLFANASSVQAAAEDLLWTLLNSYEFLFIQ